MFYYYDQVEIISMYFKSKYYREKIERLLLFSNCSAPRPIVLRRAQC